jgi:hypothetical protein
MGASALAAAAPAVPTAPPVPPAVPVPTAALPAPAAAAVYRYARLDTAGKRSTLIEIRVTRTALGLEIDSTELPGHREYARLGPAMLQEVVRIDPAPGAKGAPRSYVLNAGADAWLVEGAARGSLARGKNVYLGDRSFLLCIPCILDLKKTGAEARLDLILPANGRRTAMRLRALGPVVAAGADGRGESAYKASLEPADPLLRAFWPYTYWYYYRAEDLLLLRYEGPEEARRPSCIALLGD